MGKMGKDTHMKSLTTPPTYRVKRARRGRVFIAKPLPGPHRFDLSLTLCLVLRDLLKFSETARESKFIIKSGKLMVDYTKVYEPRWPVGLMDVISMEGVNEKFRLLVNRKGQLVSVKIPEEEANLKPCRVSKKYTTRGGFLHITFHDGRDISVPPEMITINVGDSILLELPSLNIRAVAQLTEGSIGYCYKGKSSGLYGRIENITKPAFKRPSTVSLRTSSGELITTIKDYVFVVGSDNPWISLEDI